MGPLGREGPRGGELAGRAPERGRGPRVVPEVEVLEGELRLDNAGSLDTRAQHVLLSGHVARGYQALQVGEVAAGDAWVWVESRSVAEPRPRPHAPPARSLAGGIVELVLRGAIETGLDTRVLPQPLDDVRHLFRHRALLDGVRHVHQLPGVVLGTGGNGRW